MALYTSNNRRLNDILRTNRGGTYAVATTTIFIVVLMISLAIMPAYRSISEQIENNKLKAQYLLQLNQKKDSMDRLLQQYNENGPLIEIFNEYNLASNKNELITANLEKLGRDYQVSLLSINFDKNLGKKEREIETIAGILAQPVSMQFRGNLVDLQNLLAHIEKFPVILHVTVYSFTHGAGLMNSSSAIAQDTQFELSLSGQYYFWEDRTSTSQ